ncbi:MAG: group II intron reverse transcriptase/maturase [Desulfobacterales bacterium]|nr:group II intron reverse transcriptase/maturase [Desulfobacterales bacterium]MDD4072313.1 group II intron reverse transcriptase/maturase [Desulfobacterales bacterium]MDD4391320.1 group II intron reverse transcriptase/maturase [Desulfobacterales bacterium]
MVHYTSEMLSQNHWWEERRVSDSPLYADGVSYQAYYSEVGKAHYMGKDLTEVRSLQRKLVPDNVGLGQYEQTSLRGIAIKAGANGKHRFQNLYRYLNAPFLHACWRGLNKHAASGVDKVTAQAYEKNLEANIQGLAERLKTRRYRAKLIRRCYIPKENGKKRPLGIPVLEDRLVQLACAKLLSSIFEADFLDNSYGYRPKRSAKDAVNDLRFNLQFGKYGYVVEADIKGFFGHMDHDWLLRMLRERIDDTAFLNLICKWLKAGILDTDGKIIHPETGTPQGGIVSPVLANVYLHFALDLWFEKVVKAHCRGDALLLRYADDFVCAFQYRSDAHRFFDVLPKRLSKFDLMVAPEKTHLMRFSRFHPSRSRRIVFLGFETYWTHDNKGLVRVMQRTARKKLQGACRRIKDWIRKNRHSKGIKFITALNRRLRGHYNYYSVVGNSRSLWRFYSWAVECAFKWLNRRGGKRKSFTWKVFLNAIERLGIVRPKLPLSTKRHRVFS